MRLFLKELYSIITYKTNISALFSTSWIKKCKTNALGLSLIIVHQKKCKNQDLLNEWFVLENWFSSIGFYLKVTLGMFHFLSVKFIFQAVYKFDETNAITLLSCLEICDFHIKSYLLSFLHLLQLQQS